MSDENGPSEQAGHAARADGTFCWNELRTRDVAAAKSFYADVFGWTSDDRDMGPAGIHTIFKCGDQDVGSLLAMPPEAGAAPPAWLSYIAVDDVDAAADKCVRAGGHVRHPPTDIANVGRFSVLQDPTGATFAVYRTERDRTSRKRFDNRETTSGCSAYTLRVSAGSNTRS